MTKALISLLIVSALLSFAVAENGFDFDASAGLVSSSTFECLAGQSLDFAIMQVWDKSAANTNFISNYQNALSAGINHVDAYATLCLKCEQNTTKMFASISQNLPADFSGRLFLSFDSNAKAWSTNATLNLEYLKALASKLHLAGISLGIMSNPTQWATVFGSATAENVFSSLPLWYVALDGVDGVNANLATFGGWKVIEVKQYQANQTVCNTLVNLDFVNVETPSNKNTTHHSANKTTKPTHKSTKPTPGQHHVAHKPKPKTTKPGKPGSPGGKGHSGEQSNSFENTLSSQSSQSSQDTYSDTDDNTFDDSADNTFDDTYDNTNDDSSDAAATTPEQSNQYGNTYGNTDDNTYNNDMDNTFNNQYDDQYDNTYNDQYDNQFNNAYDNQYDNTYNDAYDNAYDNQYNDAYDNTYNNGYDNQYDNTFNNQYDDYYDNTYNDGWDNQYNNQYDNTYDNSYNNQYDNQYDNTYDDSGNYDPSDDNNGGGWSGED